MLISVILFFSFLTIFFVVLMAKDAAPEFPSHRIADIVAANQKAGKKPNRLIHEQSPYLLQHAFNPVDWYPWGEEAFTTARKQDKPIFLSIGYATCHWCHVMEHESFENKNVAAFLNEHFISIKVDREERPEVDSVYMTATQAMTGSGGWPMTVFLTHDLQPFYCGTYFPPKSAYGRPGFTDLLNGISDIWHKDRSEILTSAQRLTDHLQAAITAKSSQQPSRQLPGACYQEISQMFDAQFGGFGRAPKFPRPVVFNFLFRYAQLESEKNAQRMAMITLRKMAEGGMHDQLGGGFHRYSVDAQWRVSHFEKMLYDQAQLAISYLEAYQLNGAQFFADVARGIFRYVLRDMTAPEGGFFSAEDADSPLPENPKEKAEGAFYLWHIEEIKKLLDTTDADIFMARFGLEAGGNTLHDPQGEFGEGNVLYLAETIKDLAADFKKSEHEIEQSLQRSQQKLLQLRNKRPRPLLDDKIITSWNGLMISAFAKGYQVLGESAYLDAAQNAAKFIDEQHVDQKSGTLLRRSRDGKAGLTAHLDDYAFLAQGYLDLYEANFDYYWLERALALTEKMIETFSDSSNGGFFDTSGTDENILLRMKDSYDGAEPSGNAIAILTVLRLAEITNNDAWRKLAEKALPSFGDHLAQSPSAFPQIMTALQFSLNKPKQIIIAGNDPKAKDARGLLKEIHAHFIANRVLLFADGGKAQNKLAQTMPFLNEIKPINGKATAYVCENYVCNLPTHDVKELRKQLGG